MIIYGKQTCFYALQKHNSKIETIYLNKLSILPKDLLKKYGSKIKTIENKWAQKLSRGGNHQGILIEMEEPQAPSVESLKSGDFVLVLDGLTDVGNIGALIRSAYALGVEGVIVTGVKHLNIEPILRTSTGALFDMPLAVEQNIHNLLNDFKMSGFVSYGADMGGVDICEVQPAQKRVLVLGNEGEGLSARVSAKLDTIVSIKMAHDFDSLNVSVAGGILMQRMWV